MQSPLEKRSYGPDAINTRSNWMTTGRILGSALLGYATWKNKGKASSALAAGFAALVASDKVDGVWARRDGTTRVGKFLDPLADAVLVGSEAVPLESNDRYPSLGLWAFALRELDVKLQLRPGLANDELDLPASPLSQAKVVGQMGDVFVRLHPKTAENKKLTRTTATVATGLTLISWADLRIKGHYLREKNKLLNEIASSLDAADVPYPVFWDCDGVLVGKHNKFNIPGRMTKALPRAVPDVKRSFESFAEAEDFTNAAVATSRDKLLRGRQTPRQLSSQTHDTSLNLVDHENIIYSDHKYAQKIRDVLLAGAAQIVNGKKEKNGKGQLIPRAGVEKVVLIDDSDKKIVKGILDVAKDPKYDLLMERLVFVDFGHSPDEVLERSQAVVEDQSNTLHEARVEKDNDNIVFLATKAGIIPIVAMPNHGADYTQQTISAIRNLQASDQSQAV